MKKREEVSILVVDDDEEICKMLQKFLHADFGFVNYATNPNTVMFKMSIFWFDLVITDFQMPGMTGAELVAQIRKFYPDLPVIMCTSNDKALKHGVAGVNAMIPKPIEMTEFLSTVDNVLGIS